MATDPRSPPPGDDLSPLDAYRSPLATGPPPRFPAADADAVPWGLLDVVVVAVVFLGTSMLVGGAIAIGLASVLPQEWMWRILGGSLGSLVALALSMGWLRGAAQSARPVKVTVAGAVFCSFMVLAGEITRALLRIPTSDLSPLQRLVVVAGASLGAVVGGRLAAGWLRGGTRATRADLGWRFHDWRANVLRGFVSFLVLMLPVFGLQALLNLLYERLFGPPPQHPLIQQLQDEPSGLGFLIAAFTAVIVAPVTEEFLFRGVLQGWLQRIAIRHVDFFQPSRFSQEGLEAAQDENRPAARGLLVWPIVVSSLVFALLHYSHGVAWIPLFFFALGLGYLYQRTGGLVAPIVLHLSLNASTMLILWLSSK